MSKYEVCSSSGNNNAFFSDYLGIDAFDVTYFKRTHMGYRKIVITVSNIASL